MEIRIAHYKGFPIYACNGFVYARVAGDIIEGRNVGEVKQRIQSRQNRRATITRKPPGLLHKRSIV